MINKLKVICISKETWYRITIGKVYDAEEGSLRNDVYYINDDNDNEDLILKKYFIPLAEYREQQINSILE